MPQPLCRRMVLGVSTRHPLQRGLVAHAVEARRQCARHPNETIGIVVDGIAQLVELRTRRHPQTSADERLARLQMEIETGAPLVRLAPHLPRRAAMVEPAAGVRFVRRLVPGEADVAVDAKHGSLGIAADLRGECREAAVHIVDQRAHRLAHFLFVLGTMRLEPGLLVVGGEAAKESQRCWCEWHHLLLMSEIMRATSPAVTSRRAALPPAA